MVLVGVDRSAAGCSPMEGHHATRNVKDGGSSPSTRLEGVADYVEYVKFRKEGQMDNEIMTGLICKCGHDYVCHHPAPHTGCAECDCSWARATVAAFSGRERAGLRYAQRLLEERIERLEELHGLSGIDAST